MNLIRTAAFYTLGCKVNQYETEAIKKSFVDNGVEIVEFENKADVYVVNTCTVTSIADRKNRNILRRAKKNNPNSILVATGCYAQTDGEKLKEIKEIDIIMGNEEKGKIFEILSKFHEEKIKIVEDIFKVEDYNELEFSVCREMARAYIKIQDGCDNFCSYCKIPYARGRKRSRHLENILNEVEILEKEGFKEIILIGINLGAYGEDLEEKITLEDVIQKISEYKGIKRIRFGSVYPDKITDKFIELMKTDKKIMPHLHISIQSGDDDILKAMNRKYNTEYMKRILLKIKENVKDIVFTGDVIVGFPGEEDINFENTSKFIESIGFADLHIFKYSDRIGTKAEKYTGKVSEKTKKIRSEALENIREKMYLDIRKSYCDKTVEVLIEEVKDGMGYGYTSNYIKAVILNYKGSVNNIENAIVKDIKKGLLVCEKKEKFEKREVTI